MTSRFDGHRMGRASDDSWSMCAGAELHECLCGLRLTCNTETMLSSFLTTKVSAFSAQP